ncbi:hypothetical protein MTo_03686 [Microcystis aeruginosa NIES-1211]|jgi:hypothetical protein|uniref:Uncharacterized protein n=1 Tax=Microcystis aeruginosa NIES-2519 TaxID=2303981 RepID=A0A5A5R8P0_MICAE|nr:MULTISPECIES: hypothetical protein [Microcystis]AVQ70717.1 hypothetical protein B5D77_04690 [Microcystis sp. MC19]CCI31102.1 conserved hypothetical protein [Microcystis sp. T1-4]GBL16363.1 hypothetical protein MTo_03686 [Microcystis aeruginosa NIES-1211]GCA72370.1 hypothetical protein MiYa_03921 [Microcystis aeruginosa NIES-2519]GCA85902.1 hypothetical protein MiHa_03887 [Microcystis aeruginosa NIES-2522]
MSDYKDSSSMRYFLAGLKPFAQPLFWLPLGIFSLALIGFSVYQQNPEWLDSVLDTPGMSLEEREIRANQITDAPPPTALPLPAIPAHNNTARPNKPAPTQPFNPLNTNPDNNEKPSLFAPLMPQTRQNQAPKASKSLQPIQVRPISGDTSNYPLQREIENRSRTANLNNSPNLNPGGSPNQVNPQGNNSPDQQNVQAPPSWNNTNPNPVRASSNPSNYYQPPVYQPPVYGSQPNVTGYPNQGMPPSNNGTPNQVPPPSINRGFTIQQPINARPSGY